MGPSISRIRGFLIDLDGVLYVGDTVIEGAVETIDSLKTRGFPCRFATNTTTKSLITLYNKLKTLGLPIEKKEIISAPRAAVMHLKKKGSPTCFLCMNDDVKRDFAEFRAVEENPDVVIIGDIGDRWNYTTMSRLFHLVIDGAEIVALHKGRYWHEPDGLRLDIGAFVAGLEYATGTTATIMGKPSRDFFEMAVEDMQLAPAETAMIGDDIESDVGGARAAGLLGILVKTGKYREELAARSRIIPDIIINSIRNLPELL